MREAARVACSAVLTLLCLLPLASPLALAGARYVTAGISRWAWDLASQAAWEYFSSRLLAAPALPLVKSEANTTAAATIPAILLGAESSVGVAQTMGMVSTWSCLALSAWRKARAR